MNNTSTKTESTKWRILVTILFACIAAALYFVFLNQIHNWVALETSRQEMEETAQYLKKACEDIEESYYYARQADEEIYEQDIAALCFLAKNDPDFEISDQYLEGKEGIVTSGSVMITDPEGQILASSDGKRRELSGEICDLIKNAMETSSTVHLLQMAEFEEEKSPEEEEKSLIEAINSNFTEL